MAPHHSQDVPRNPGGKFNSQRSDGSVVIDLPSGYSFVLSRTKVASTGMGRLLAEGLRQNEPLYWTTRASFEGSEIDQIYCARIDKPPQRALSYTPSDHADHGSSYTYHPRPYDEPPPYSLHGRRDIESVRRRRLCDNPLYSTSYEERARRSSLAYEQLPLPDDPGPSQTVQDSSDDVPPPYTSRDSLPPYASSSGDQEDEIEEVVPTRISAFGGAHYAANEFVEMGGEQQWVAVQEKTFTKWLNAKVSGRDVAVKNLVTDLSDGVILIHLLEVLGNESLGRYASRPKLRVQRFENVNVALNFIKARGIQMTNIGAEDVVDGNRKIILGLIWTLILRFTINDINEEGMTAKEGLLLWCQRKTACYEEVEVRDFSASWNDGLAFCALLDIHRPDLIDYEKLDKSDHRGNMKLAFEIASKEIGIPDLLDVEDVCEVAKPDERSLMTYIAYWFHAFSQMERVENAGRRVEKFVANMNGAWSMQNSFEQRMKNLMKEIQAQRQAWKVAAFTGTYVDAKEQSNQFSVYKKSQKRKWVAEKSDLAALLGNIKTKMSTYRLRAYEPPDELKLEVLDQEWAVLLRAERDRSQVINETIRDIKNALRRTFADKANDFALTLSTLSLAIAGLSGDLADQLGHVRRLHSNLPPLSEYLQSLATLSHKCDEANIEENDFTTYTYDELAYELDLVRGSVTGKMGFLENQMIAREMTNLTPIQLEEFESVFRHFDKDLSNTLQEIEFSAALASLSLVYDEEEMHQQFMSISSGKGYVTFEQFIRFMVSVTEDQNTAEQVFQSFREVADGKPYVTELDLRHSLIPEELVEDLLSTMPQHKGPDLQEDRDLPKYDYISFMENMTQGELNTGSRPNSNQETSPERVINGH